MAAVGRGPRVAQLATGWVGPASRWPGGPSHGRCWAWSSGGPAGYWMGWPSQPLARRPEPWPLLGVVLGWPSWLLDGLAQPAAGQEARAMAAVGRGPRVAQLATGWVGPA